MNGYNLNFLSLLSDGFDSPISSYLMIKKGFHPSFITFVVSDTDEKQFKDKIISIVKKLKAPLKNPITLHFVNHFSNLNVIQKECDRKLTCILCKRLMLRIAMRIANMNNINLLVTGDILGEQASQTLDNLHAYNDLIKNFILLRPLIAWDKLEVMALSRKIGIYELCSQKTSTCSYNPTYPETHAKKNEIQSAEQNFDVDSHLLASLEKMETLRI